jgi:hypothetical protein
MIKKTGGSFDRTSVVEEAVYTKRSLSVLNALMDDGALYARVLYGAIMHGNLRAADVLLAKNLEAYYADAKQPNKVLSWRDQQDDAARKRLRARIRGRVRWIRAVRAALLPPCLDSVLRFAGYTSVSVRWALKVKLPLEPDPLRRAARHPDGVGTPSPSGTRVRATASSGRGGSPAAVPDPEDSDEAKYPDDRHPTDDDSDEYGDDRHPTDDSDEYGDDRHPTDDDSDEYGDDRHPTDDDDSDEYGDHVFQDTLCTLL